MNQTWAKSFRDAAIRFVLILGIALFAVARARPQIESVEVGVDDANIFFVYGKNLAAGHGFVWNAGGERVEGFSSMLWVLFMAPFFRLAQNPERALLVASVTLVSAALAALTLLMDRQSARNRARAAGGRPLLPSLGSLAIVLWTFLSPAYTTWTMLTLMETGLWSAVAIAITVAAVRAAEEPESRTRLATLAALVPCVMLARPEGMMWAGVLPAAYFAALLVQGGRLRPSLKRLAVPLAAYALTMLALVGFRLAYFGHPFPNTYYAKVSPDRAYTLQAGYEYFLAFLDSHPALRFFAAIAVVFLCVFAVWALASFLRTNTRDIPSTGGVADLSCAARKAEQEGRGGFPRAVSISALTAMIVSVAASVGLLVPVLVGGDHFTWFRFYQPVLPLLIVPAWCALRLGADAVARRAPDARRNALAWASCALAIPLAFLLKPDADAWRAIGKCRLVPEFVLAREGRDLGDALNRVFDGETLPAVGAIAVGGIQYAYRGPVNDLMGLNNVEMAHHPGDRKGIKNHAAFSKEVFYRQRPDVMIPIAMPGGPDFTPEQAAPELARYLDNRWVLEPLQGLTREPAFLELYTLAIVNRRDRPAGRWIAGFFRNDYLELLRAQDMYAVATVNR